jgi:hypothetical protein
MLVRFLLQASPSPCRVGRCDLKAESNCVSGMDRLGNQLPQCLLLLRQNGAGV